MIRSCSVPEFFFCSRDCCLCTKHQSVKELRHAGSKGKTSTEKTTQKQKQNTNQKTTKTKPTATTRHPFAAGETGETGETGTTSIKKLVQLCYERQAFFTREDVFTLTCREHSRVKAGSGKRPSKPNHKTTQKPKTTPETNPHKKKTQQNKPKHQNQPFTLVRRRAQVARARLEQSN